MKIILCVSCFSLFLLMSCTQNPTSVYKHSFFRMDTVFEVTVLSPYAKRRSVGGLWLSRIFGEKNSVVSINKTWMCIDSLLKNWDASFSQTDTSSEVFKLNRDTNVSRQVSQRLFEMLTIGLAYGDSLHGMFDITILPLKELWGLGEQGGLHLIPSPDDLSACLRRVGYHKLTLKKDPKTLNYADVTQHIDVGGIAKKYALFLVSTVLDSLGYSDYLINAGGDIISKGKRPDGKSWRIGIQHPRKSDTLLSVFSLDSGCVMTSGDYERYWITPDGRRVHHIFNPLTGYSGNKNQSVTIWSMDPVAAGILSTGLFCLPADSILGYVQNRPWIQCCVVDSLGKTYVSKGWNIQIIAE